MPKTYTTMTILRGPRDGGKMDAKLKASVERFARRLRRRERIGAFFAKFGILVGINRKAS